MSKVTPSTLEEPNGRRVSAQANSNRRLKYQPDANGRVSVQSSNRRVSGLVKNENKDLNGNLVESQLLVVNGLDNDNLDDIIHQQEDEDEVELANIAIKQTEEPN